MKTVLMCLVMVAFILSPVILVSGCSQCAGVTASPAGEPTRPPAPRATRIPPTTAASGMAVMPAI